jgi:uncharacterized Ntn-hydrolase superfamily protein
MTWSILVRDAATGALGAAVATRFFAVGALAIHVEGGVAALATQALINPMYAPHGSAAAARPARRPMPSRPLCWGRMPAAITGNCT